MAQFTDHDSYIDAAPDPFRPLLGALRAQLARVLPDAEAVIMYDMPGFAVGGTVVAGYAAFSRQCGLYVSAGAIAELSDEIAAAGLKATKTGVTFTPRKPVPPTLVERLVLASRRHHGV